jgi:hypothetical protein
MWRGHLIGWARIHPTASNDWPIMLLKIIMFIAAMIPVIVFVRKMLFRRPSRLSVAFGEFKKQIDYAVWIFLCLIAAVGLFAAGKLLWTWWETL